MNVTPQMLLIVCPLVFLASLIDSIGGGGGLISLPAYLLAGLPAQTASGTNKFSASFGTLLASIRFFRSGKLSIKPALLAMLGAFPGSYVGAYIQCRLPEETIRTFMLIAIPAVAIVLLFARARETQLKPLTRTRLIGCFFIGLVCGLYDGFFGPGTGTILIVLLTACVGMDMVTASGTAKLVNLASNTAALISFVIEGKVLFMLAIPTTLCSVLGGYLGASLALKKGARLVKFVMLGVLAFLIAKLALEFFGISI